MREELKKILTANRVQLVGNITLDEFLWNHLISKGILDKHQRDGIILNNTMYEQIGKLLDFIERGPDEVFEGLRQCLYDTNQAHVADTWLCSEIRSPGPALSITRDPSVEAAAGNQEHPRIDPPQSSNPPSFWRRVWNFFGKAEVTKELPAPIGVSCSQECPLPEKDTDSDSLLSHFQCDLDELNESLSAEDKKQSLPDAITVNLRQHANFISEKLVLIDDLLTLLVAEKCIHARLKQIILAKDKGMDQARELIECISKSHFHTYKVFLKFLQCTNQSHLFDILNTGDAVISSIVKIRVELYMNSFVYNGAESLRQLYKQVQADICNEESEISNLFKSYHPRLEALSVDIGSMIIYVWSPCPDASTSLQKACDNGDLGQRIQSALSDITGTCLYDPRVIVTCIQDNGKTRPSLESQMSSLTIGTVLPKVAKLESSTASFSDVTISRPMEEKWRDSGSSLIDGFCAQLSKAGRLSPEVAFHVQDSVEEDGKMTRLVKELGLERDISDKVEAIVWFNNGSFDLLLNSLGGVFGNTKYHRLLTPVLGVDGVDGTALKRARYVVGMILKSKRRFFKNGAEFCIRVVASSQQRELIGALKNVIGTRWLTSDDPETLMAADILRILEMKTKPVRPQKAIGTGWLTSEDPETHMAAEKPVRPQVSGLGKKQIGTEWVTSDDPDTRMAAEQLRRSEMKTNPVRLQVSGLWNAKYYSQATSLAHVGEITAAGMMKEGQHLNNVTSICFKRATITYEVIEVLSRITSLYALCFVDTDMGLASKRSEKHSSFWSLFAINVQYLRLSSCGLTSGDVNALLAACGSLKHLDISGNAAIKRVKVRSLSSLTGLSVEDTSLTDDDMIQLVKGSRLSLVFLNASSLSMSTRSCCDILNLCPQLREFYVRGDGLLEVLHRGVKCCIEHIYLSGCSDSLLSLRYVLKNHPSITCITATTMDDHARSELSDIVRVANHRVKSLFVREHMAPCEDLVNWRSNLTQLWFEGNKPLYQTEIARFISRTTSLHTVGIKMDPPYAERFLKALERPLQRLWLVVSKKEEYADVIEETEKRLRATPGMIQLVTDPDGLYGTYTRESGVFYTHLPDTLPNDFRPVIGNTIKSRTMHKELKKILTANRVQLIDNITLDDSLWNQLLAKEILNEDQRDRIILNNTTDAQIGKLLDLIKRGHDKVFDDLRQCLYDTNQAHVADNWLCSVVRSPGPNPPIKRGPSVEAASGNQKRPRIAPSQPSNPPSSRELTAKRGVSCRECPSPEKGTDSDGSVSPNTLLRLFQCNLDLLNESESADDKEQCLPDALIDNLRHHANTISERLNLIDDLLTLLVTEKCMHPRSKQIILENGKDADQASDLVKFITKSHLHTYK